jgi:hypothetical protein
MALMTYLLKDRHGTYYFRRVIPPDLRAFMPAPWRGKANFKRSLGTKKPSAAKIEASKALRECTVAFQTALRAKDGIPADAKVVAKEAHPITIADIESDVIAEVLVADDAEREDGDDRRRMQTVEERAAWPDLVSISFDRQGMEEDHAYAYGERLSQLNDEYRQAYARRDTSIIDAELRHYLRRRGLQIDAGSDLYRQAGLAMLKGNVRAHEMLLERQAGKIVSAPQPRGDKGPRLSEAFGAWKSGGKVKGARQLSSRTLLEAEHSVRRFQEWHGDLLLGDIDKAKARDFRDALMKVRTRLPRKLIKLPLRDLLRIDLSDLPTAHANCQRRSKIASLSGAKMHQ